MENNVNVDEINDIMTEFLDNVVKVAKIHTEYKEKLSLDNEHTKFSCSMVKLFNQYQQLYVYIDNQEEYAKELVELSKLVLEALSFTPYELMEGGFFKKRKELKANKEAKELAYKKVTSKVESINEIINSCVSVPEAEVEECTQTD